MLAHQAPPRGLWETGRIVRRSVPGSGLSALSFIVPRHRISSGPPLLPPSSGLARRRRLPPTGWSADVLHCIRVRQLRPAPLPFVGRTRRRKVPPSGLSALQVVPGRRSGGPLWLHAPLPFLGCRRRGRLPRLTLVDGITPVSRKVSRAVLLALPRPLGLRRRGRVPPSGLVGLAIVPRRRLAWGTRAPLALLGGRRRRLRGVQLTTGSAVTVTWDEAFEGVIPTAAIAGGVLTLTYTARDGRMFTKTQTL